MLRAVKQKTRVRREVERRLFQAVIFQIHADVLAQFALNESQRWAASKNFPLPAFRP
jgi:hypothetical protein